MDELHIALKELTNQPDMANQELEEQELMVDMQCSGSLSARNEFGRGLCAQ